MSQLSQVTIGEHLCSRVSAQQWQWSPEGHCAGGQAASVTRAALLCPHQCTASRTFTHKGHFTSHCTEHAWVMLANSWPLDGLLLIAIFNLFSLIWELFCANDICIGQMLTPAGATRQSRAPQNCELWPVTAFQWLLQSRLQFSKIGEKLKVKCRNSLVSCLLHATLTCTLYTMFWYEKCEMD